MELTPTWCLWETRKCLSEGARKFVIRKPEHETVADKQFGLNTDIPVTRQTPPTFLLQAEDDHVGNVNDSLAYYIALKKAGVPVEMHLYAQGGHACGLRRTKLPVTGWPQLVETWLGTIGMIPERFAFEAQCPRPGSGPGASQATMANGPGTILVVL